MKITLDVPDGTMCAFLNYVFQRGFGLCLGTKSLGSEDLHDGAVIKVEPTFEEEDAGNE